MSEQEPRSEEPRPQNPPEPEPVESAQPDQAPGEVPQVADEDLASPGPREGDEDQ